MNLGIFIENLGETEIVDPLVGAINSVADSKQYRDISIFYQDAGLLKVQPGCGMFNSTDICYFQGKLVVTFLDGLKTALNEINNREIFFFYGLNKNKNIFGHLEVLNGDQVKVVAYPKDVEYVKKKLGRQDVISCDSLGKILEVI